MPYSCTMLWLKLQKSRKIRTPSVSFQRKKTTTHQFFHKLTQTELIPKHTKEILLPILYKIFPRCILYPAIAQGEYAAVKTYTPVAEKFLGVESVKNDEKRHGDTVKGLLNKEPDSQFPEGMFRFEKRIEH